MTLLISGQPNFTKFARKTWIYVAMNPFGKHLWKFAGFQKGQILREHCQRLPTSSRDFSEMITNRGKSQQVGMHVGFPFVPLESTHSHSPGLQDFCVQETTFLDLAGSSV